MICLPTALPPPCREALRGKPIAPAPAVLALFSNAEAILDVNAELLQHLADGMCATGPGTKRLSLAVPEAFLRVVPFLRLYGVYCKGYWKALETHRDLTTTCTAYNDFLRYCSLKPETRRQDITSFLIKPVQRICKYPLLFRDLL